MSEQDEPYSISLKIVFRGGQEYNCFVTSRENLSIQRAFTDWGKSSMEESTKVDSFLVKVGEGDEQRLRMLTLSFADVLYIG